MRKKELLIEPYNRYCPICGDGVKQGESLHKCNNEKIKDIEKNREKYGKVEKTRTYDDKLKEFETYFNQDIYYEEDEDEPNYI